MEEKELVTTENKVTKVSPESKKKAAPKKETKETQATNLKKKIEDLEAKERERDMRPVTGTFKNFQSPGIETVFSCRKYKGEQITTYKLRDGQTATIPYYVAKMLRQECYYKRNQRYKGTDGIEDIKLGEKVKLMDFYPHTEFIPGTEVENSLVTVEMRK